MTTDKQSYKAHSDQRYGCTSYSHCGEDIMVVNLLELMGLKKPTYIDVGAHHPFTISNTALLHSRGSRGVNIEANPNLIPLFKEHRPEDLTINIGVGPEAGKMTFYMWDSHSGRNTFSKEWSEKLEKLTDSCELDVVTLNSIVDEHCGGIFPDFMSIDIEGMDLPVLQQVDFSKSAPKIICVEAWPADADAFKAALEPKGFFQYTRHAMDMIFVHKDYKEKVY